MGTVQIKWLQFLLAIACIISGILAGGNIDRYIVQVPAWRQVSIISWAEYSRHADLGNGLFIYPFEAFGGFLPLAIASIIARKNSAFLPVILATAFAFLGLVFTLFAAPVMLGIKDMKNDPVFLQQAFDRFHYWGSFRAVAQVLSFFACVWAMGKIFALKTI